MSNKIALIKNETGVLTVKNFKPRTLGDALSAELCDGWKKKPKKLAKSVMLSPDLLTITLFIMKSMGEGIEEVKAELNAEGQIDADAIKALLANEIVADTKTMAPADWIHNLNKDMFKGVVKAFEAFLETPLQPVWSAFNPSLDSPETRAVHALRLMSAETLAKLEISFADCADYAIPAYAMMALDAEKANEVAEECGISLVFEEIEVPAEPEPAPAPAKKRTARRTARKSTSAKKSA